MAVGKVIWFNDFKGYGFIEDENGRRFLVQPSAIKGDSTKSKLKPGTKVKFVAQSEDATTIAEVDGLAKSIEFV